jgi:ribonuclease Z
LWHRAEDLGGAALIGEPTMKSVFIGLTCLVFMSTVPTVTRAESDFTVTLLGTGSPIPLVTRSGPSTLVQVGGQTLLFDAGRGVPVQMRQIKVPVAKIDVLFITHYHSDHVSGILDVWLTGWLAGTGTPGRVVPFASSDPQAQRI